MSKQRLAVLVVVVMVAALALGACGPVAEPVADQEATAVAEVEAAASATLLVQAAEPEPTETPLAKTPAAETAELEGLWYPLDGELGSLDPQWSGDWLVVGQLIEGLFEYRGDGSIEPTGATGFEVSDDGLVYTVHLRPEAAWSDGEPVVAQHFVDGVLRLLEPEAEAEYAWTMYDVEGAEAYNTGETDDPATVGMRAVDDLTLEIRLAEPAAYLEVLLASPAFYPVRLDAIEEHGERWTEPGNYLSNGPYLLDAWDHGGVVLAKNPSYWNADAVSIETITLPSIEDIVAAYEQDELHSTGREVLSDDVPRILADPVLSQELHVLPRPGVYYIGLNTLRPPTDDLLVRKALALALDRRALLEDIGRVPELAPLSCTTPPTIMAHQPYGTCGYTFDPERARQYLAEAGYPDGEGFPPLQIMTFSGGSETAEALAAMLEENLGISTEVRPHYGWGDYVDYLDSCNETKEALAACKVNAYPMGWVMEYGDPQNQLEVLFAPYSGYQFTGWESERYEELLDLARSEPDTAQRSEYYREADKILSEEEVAVVPLMSWQWTTLVKEGVTFEFPPFGDPAFKHWALP